MKNNLLPNRFASTLIFIALTLFYTSSSAQWITKADAFRKRSDLSESIIYKSKLYTFLGFYDYDRHTNVTSEAYDPATDSYTLLAPIPDSAASMTHEKIVLIDSTVWLIGGRLGQNPGPLTSAIWIYNLNADTWSRGPELKDPATGNPIPWAAGGAALLGRILHIFGGFIIDACNHDQSIYHLTLDVDSWLSDTTKPAAWKNNLTLLPLKRNHFSTVVLGGKIYALGGQFGHDCEGGQEQRYSHVYDPATDSWAKLPLLPHARSHAEGSSFAIDGKIFMLAGQDQDGESTDKVVIFDPAANNGKGKWKEESALTLPGKFEGGTAKVINSTLIYSHGGEGTSANPGNITYTRTITRNPVYAFGFSSGCLKLTVDSGASAKGETLLFTIDSSKRYHITSNADWLTINRNASGIATPNGRSIGITVKTAGLTPGEYNGSITAAGTDSGTNFTEAFFCINLIVRSTKYDSHILEAETAGLSGIKVAKNHPDFSGAGFADYLHLSGDYIEWTINKSGSSPALLSFRYANGKEGDRPLTLSVNGIAADSNLSFPSTGNWQQWATVTARANLTAGINAIRLTAINHSGPNIDYLTYINDTAALQLQQPLSGKTNISKSRDFLKAYVSPNPASAMAKLIVNTNSILPVNAEIADLSGRTYRKLKLTNVLGSNHIIFLVKDIPAGVYVVRVRQGRNQVTAKFMVGNKNLQ